MLRATVKAGSVLTLLLIINSAVVSAQTVGRVSSTPLNIAASSDAYSRASRPAPATSIDNSVVRASYLQGASTKPAPVNRIASSRAPNLGSTGATPLTALPPPARSVPNYTPMTYSPTSYAPQQGVYYPQYGAPYTQRPSYMPGAANRAPTLTAYQAGNCGPTGAPVYPIGGAAPVPYATPQAAPGARPFMPLTSMPNQVYISRGLIGQPVVYVPGQPLRNGLRYILP